MMTAKAQNQLAGNLLRRTLAGRDILAGLSGEALELAKIWETAYDGDYNNAQYAASQIAPLRAKGHGNCPRCDGTGNVRSMVRGGVCFKCNGKGSV